MDLNDLKELWKTAMKLHKAGTLANPEPSQSIEAPKAGLLGGVSSDQFYIFLRIPSRPKNKFGPLFSQLMYLRCTRLTPEFIGVGLLSGYLDIKLFILSSTLSLCLFNNGLLCSWSTTSTSSWS